MFLKKYVFIEWLSVTLYRLYKTTYDIFTSLLCLVEYHIDFFDREKFQVKVPG